MKNQEEKRRNQIRKLTRELYQCRRQLQTLNLERSWDWEWYRSHYPQFSFQDKKLLHKFLHSKYPPSHPFQRDLRFFIRCIKHIVHQTQNGSVKVLELGGRQGHLAYQLLKLFPDIQWVNAEIIHHKQLEQLAGYHYREHVLSQELWKEKLDITQYTAFISVNTLEHMSTSEVTQLLSCLDGNRIQFLILRVCITPQGQTWEGYTATHILTMGSNQIKQILHNSYQLLDEKPFLDIKWSWCGFFARRNSKL